MRYFFHVRNEGIFTEDPEGTDLLDAEAALSEARAMARDFAIQDLMQPQRIANRMIEITDSIGTNVRNFRARDVLDGPAIPEAA
jgi:hypothetical protein